MVGIAGNLLCLWRQEIVQSIKMRGVDGIVENYYAVSVEICHCFRNGFGCGSSCLSVMVREVDVVDLLVV